MIADLDIWRAAALLVKRHGKDAALVACHRIDELLANGDLEGRAVWYLILKAVSEVERTKPVEGERVNWAIVPSLRRPGRVKPIGTSPRSILALQD